MSGVTAGTGTAPTICPGPGGVRPSWFAFTNDSAHRATSAWVSRVRPAGSCTTTATWEINGTTNFSSDRCCAATAALSAGSSVPTSLPIVPSVDGAAGGSSKANATQPTTISQRPATTTVRYAEVTAPVIGPDPSGWSARRYPWPRCTQGVLFPVDRWVSQHRPIRLDARRVDSRLAGTCTCPPPRRWEALRRTLFANQAVRRAPRVGGGKGTRHGRTSAAAGRAAPRGRTLRVDSRRDRLRSRHRRGRRRHGAAQRGLRAATRGGADHRLRTPGRPAPPRAPRPRP